MRGKLLFDRSGKGLHKLVVLFCLAAYNNTFGLRNERIIISEMEYIECSSYNTFYPFQNKHQIYQHVQTVKMLCAY